MQEYWHERFEELEEDKNHEAELFAAAVLVLFSGSIKQIKNHIAAWYGRYVTNNIATTQDARRFLSPSERNEFQMTLKTYMAEDVSEKWFMRLERFASRVKVTRLETLEIELQHEIEKLFGKYLKDFDTYFFDLYVDQHDHVLFEIAKGVGKSQVFEKVDMDKLRRLLGEAWAVDGKVYSSRIWDNKVKLVNEIKNVIGQGCIRGDTCREMTDEIVKRMNVSYKNAERLVKTESAFISSEAEREAYKKFGIDLYEFIAILDSRTSEICRYMDGKVIPVSQMKVGLNAPPLHCNCRSTTCPYFKADEAEGTIVDTNMTFEQWRSIFLK